MKKIIKKLVLKSIDNVSKKGIYNFDKITDIDIKATKNLKFGDFSSNIAMKLGSFYKISSKKVAKIIVENINNEDNVLKKIEIAGPGFINFFIDTKVWLLILRNINDKNGKYGSSNLGQQEFVQIEFVSSNPTGPLHIGHGRGAVVGDVMANILLVSGFKVKKEYYINDFGNQIHILGLSVYLRAKNILGFLHDFPDDCYQGDYIKEIALELIKKKPNLILIKEEDAILFCAKYASKKIIKKIRKDLEVFKVKFDFWYSEQKLYDSGKVKDTIDYYQNKGLIYEKNGAKWFLTTKFGDEKDRVVIRKNGKPTYFASDIAYHKDKFDRGFSKIIDVWGADHHGYIPRIRAVIKALGKNSEQFKVILVRLVNLLRDKKFVSMSTRSGNFVSLREIIDEVGSDAARFLFLTRHHDSFLNFDIEIAKKKNNENPVYYVQYVHARISNILIKSDQMGINKLSWDLSYEIYLTGLNELELIKKLSVYPKIIQKSCILMEPHRISFYLIELASEFHSYYNKKRILSKNIEKTRARIFLIKAVKIVIKNGLKLLGISAPINM